MEGKVKRALLSVTDKRGVSEFAKALSSRGIEIVASGKTAAAVRRAGVDAADISEVTGFPEIMDGRVKTLHPTIHGGILADRTKSEHTAKAAELGIDLIDLVAVNLYRFRDAASDPKLGERDVVEEIDIGGPTLIRSAAKNFHGVTVVVDPDDYDWIIAELEENGGALPLETRRMLASKAFHHTAAYDAAISWYFDRRLPAGELPDVIVSSYGKIRELRYGENPHQLGALYRSDTAIEAFGDFEQHQGKELSYNNIQDMYAAFLLARDLGTNGCAIIKHMNPCGAAVCRSAAESFERARRTDPVSAFGSVVCFNCEVDGSTAALCKELFLEVILARGFTNGGRETLQKKKNLRLITAPASAWNSTTEGLVTRGVGDLLLLQQVDEGFPELDNWQVVTSRKPEASEVQALKLAWKVVKHIRSNAIVIGDGEGTLGVGAGQMSRVDSCRIAVDKAQREELEITGAAAGSDAFFPFFDGVEVLAEAGVRSVIQPGGSIRDEEVIKAADALGLAMVLTGRRHFRH